MSSLQSQKSQRQQSSLPERINEEPRPILRHNSQSSSPKSPDSQAVFLNEQSSSSVIAPGSSNATRSDSSLAPLTSTSEPRKCWICFGDETEDDNPNIASWKTPCPCALTAHESCLLDWIGDMEAPEANRSASTFKEIKCPQCKSEIRLSRPRNMVVEALGRLEKLSGQMLLPGIVLGSVYTLFICSSHHGAHTIRMIFGPIDAEAILAPTRHTSLIEFQLQRYLPILDRPLFRDWRGPRVELGLPLIPAALIASRTSLADAFLPFLPILFFATHPQHQHELTYGFWPPSAALTLVTLPYLRSIYEEYLERVWGERERRWTREIRPNLDREGNGADRQGQGNGANNEDEGMVQLQIDIGEDTDDEQAEAEAVAAAQADSPQDALQDRAPPLDQPPADEYQHGQANPPQGDIAHDAQDDAQGQPNNRRHRRVDITFLAYATGFAETTLGALFFPTVSATMGIALKLALPASWTVARIDRGNPMPTGLLQTRWGRSIVGGCLFVVLKDALRIYCKWKMAEAYRNRRVLNYDKQLGKIIS